MNITKSNYNIEMGTYIKDFETHSAYNTYITGNDKVLPNVSYCEDQNEVHYNPLINYRTKYLTLKSHDGGSMNVFFEWFDNDYNVEEYGNTFPQGHEPEYSLDGGRTWTKFVNKEGSYVWGQDELDKRIAVPAGGEILLKAEMNEYYTLSYNDYCAIYWGDDTPYKGTFAIGADEDFDISGNLLSLVYGDNFRNFNQITNENVNFNQTFRGSSVINAENLYLDFGGNSYMFEHAFRESSIEIAPKSMANTVSYAYYYGMFYDCTSLTTAPALPATTLETSCYYRMFRGCTSLTSAPELPATTLTNSCYGQMFYGCTSLNYVKCLATDISANSCTSSWLYNVASNGTFVKDSSMSSWTSGGSGIPNNWTVQNASE